MSTITGVAPNALHIAPPNQDMANNASLLREQDKNAFAPVEESSATDHSKNQPAENPSRQAERQSDRELQTDLSRLLKESRLSNENRVTENINQEKPETLESRPLNSKPAETVSRSPDNSSIKAETAVSEEVVSKELSRDQLNDGAKEQDLSKQARESVESRRDQRELQMDQQKIAGLKQRDREVKNHEQAHKAVGGQYAGAMSLDYERGPDGVNYAVAGEVQINLSRSADNPEADLIKAQQVRQAALAPADPSAQDRAVASAATQLALDAQERIRVENNSVESKESEEKEETKDVAKETETDSSANIKAEEERASAAAEKTKEHLEELMASTLEASARILEVHQIDENRKALGKLIDFQV